MNTREHRVMGAKTTPKRGQRPEVSTSNDKAEGALGINDEYNYGRSPALIILRMAAGVASPVVHQNQTTGPCLNFPNFYDASFHCEFTFGHAAEWELSNRI